LENILVTKTGQIKITDFGISNWMKPGGFLDTFCGSPFYWSPEMILRIQYIGPEVDIWSLGVCLYCMVTGLFPWEGATTKEQLNNAVQGRYEAPVFLSDDCKGLLRRLLDPNPKTRGTLPEIKAHPWLNDGLRIPPPKARKIENLDPDILSKLRGFGLSLEEMKDDIINHYTSQAHVLYVMMLEYRERQEEKAKGMMSMTGITPTEPKDQFVQSKAGSPKPETKSAKNKNPFKNIFSRPKDSTQAPVTRNRSTSL
jgi:serine/threonine protein kinase